MLDTFWPIFLVSSKLLRLNYLLSVPQTITVDHLMLHAPFILA